MNSEAVKIQGVAKGKNIAWMQGVAVGGSFLQGHKLLVYHPGKQDFENATAAGEELDMIVKWDDQKILQQELSPNDNTFSPQPGFQFTRSTGGDHMPPDDVIDLACPHKHPFNIKTKRNCIKYWKDAQLYNFKLPHKVEIFVMARKPCKCRPDEVADILVKMPPQGRQSGFCGNFNGQKEDDDPKTPRTLPGFFLEPNESFFAQEGPLLEGLSLVDSPENSPATGDCVGEAFTKAVHACRHLINDPGIRDGCIQDICTSGEVETAAAAADGIAIMKGIQQDVGAMKECEPI